VNTLIRLAVVVAILLLATPPAAEAQGQKVWRIGYPSPGEVGTPYLAAFRQRLRELNYVEGQHLALEIRTTDGSPEQYARVAAELVRLKVDIIVASSNAVIAAAQKATTSIPIVMVIASDPVANGFVASLARPGGNITGLAAQPLEVTSKRLQLLKEAVPNLSRVAVLWAPEVPGARRALREVEAAATALRLQLQVVEVRNPGELESAFAAATRGRAGAVISSAGSLGFAHRA